MPEDSHVQLREYIERILDEREKALTLTATNLEHRLERLNSLRDDVIHDRGMFVTKDTYADQHEELKKRVERVENKQSKMLGVGLTLISLAGIIGAVLGAIVTHIFFR